MHNVELAPSEDEDGKDHDEDRGGTGATTGPVHRRAAAPPAPRAATVQVRAAAAAPASSVNDDAGASSGGVVGLRKSLAARQLVVVLELATLDIIQSKSSVELLSCDRHSSRLKRLGRTADSARPDIVHQCLLMLQDSPLNQRGLLKVFIHTARGELVDVDPSLRVPRTFDRFCGLFGTCTCRCE